MGTEVYSWRLSSELRQILEREARARGLSIAAVLNQAVSEWVSRRANDIGDDDEQHRLHEAALHCLGTIEGHHVRRAESGRQTIRKRLRRRHER